MRIQITLMTALAALLTAVAATAPAATVVWTGGGANTNWNNPDNWSGGIIPLDANENDILTYSGTPSPQTTSTNNVQNLFDISHIIFDSTLTLSVTVGGNSIRPSGVTDVIQNSSFTQTISSAIESLGDFAVGGTGSGKLVLGGNLTITGQNNRTATFAINDFDVDFNGNFTLAQGRTWNISKSGSGTLKLAGSANAVNGTTTITAGTLLLTGTLNGGTVNVNGGVLQGTGTMHATATNPASVSQTVNINNGGTIAPGESAGTLTLGANTTSLNFAVGSTYAWELAALSTANPGTDFDLLQQNSGNLIINGGALLPTFIGSASAPSLSNAFWQNTQSWIVINNTGAGTATGALTVDNTAWASEGFFATAIGGTGNDLILTWTPIPEPASLALVAAGAVLLVPRRKRANAWA
jgi:fibronectin-binding autotransporter adhesin